MRGNATHMRVATNRAGILLAIMRPGQHSQFLRGFLSFSIALLAQVNTAITFVNKKKISKDLIFSAQTRRELGCHLLCLTERRWEAGDLKETDGFKPTGEIKKFKTN